MHNYYYEYSYVFVFFTFKFFSFLLFHFLVFLFVFSFIVDRFLFSLPEQFCRLKSNDTWLFSFVDFDDMETKAFAITDKSV